MHPPPAATWPRPRWLACGIRPSAGAGPRPRRIRRTPACLNGDVVQRPALFASTLQRPDAPGADVVAETITATVRQLVPMAAVAGWRKSLVTIQRQPPSACAGPAADQLP